MRHLIALLIILAASQASAFSYATGGCSTSGCAESEQWLHTNANEIDTALDTIESDITTLESAMTTAESDITTLQSAVASAGTVTGIGNCTTGNCFTANGSSSPTGTALYSQTDIFVHLDDNNTVAEDSGFYVYDGANALIFGATESGVLSVSGLTMDDTDISSDADITVGLDQNGGSTSSFTIRNGGDIPVLSVDEAGALIVGNASQDGTITFINDDGTGDGTVTFGAIANHTSTYLWPSATTTNGYQLTNTGTGTLTWADAGAVEDGTYSDIVVSGTGTAWDIAADAVGADELDSTADVTFNSVTTAPSDTAEHRLTSATGADQVAIGLTDNGTTTSMDFTVDDAGGDDQQYVLLDGANQRITISKPIDTGTNSIDSPAKIASSTGGALATNTITLATAAADYDLPDECDSATGAWVTLMVRDVSETASLTVSDTGDTIVYKGLSLGANDELNSPGAALDSVTVVCMAADLWYATSNSGDWTDGGVAD